MNYLSYNESMNFPKTFPFIFGKIHLTSSIIILITKDN